MAGRKRGPYKAYLDEPDLSVPKRSRNLYNRNDEEKAPAAEEDVHNDSIPQPPSLGINEDLSMSLNTNAEAVDRGVLDSEILEGEQILSTFNEDRRTPPDPLSSNRTSSISRTSSELSEEERSSGSELQAPPVDQAVACDLRNEPSIDPPAYLRIDNQIQLPEHDLNISFEREDEEILNENEEIITIAEYLIDEEQVHLNLDAQQEKVEEPEIQHEIPEPQAHINLVESTHSELRKLTQKSSFTAVITTQVKSSPAEALLMCLSMAQINNLSFKAFVDSTKLLNSLFVSPVIPKSSYLLDKILNSSKGITRYFYCSKCYHDFGEQDHLLTPALHCPETGCRFVNNVKDLTKATYFVLFSISAQIELLFSDKKIWEALVNPKSVVMQSECGYLKDIYDGSCYKDFVLSLPDNCLAKIISFVFCTDGSPLFKSSSFSIWPFFLTINELPPLIRMKNLIIGGLWFGSKHPPMDLFLNPIVNHIKSLSNNGFSIRVGDNVIFLKAYALACCVDSGARGAVQGVNSHSGYYSCNWCEHPGKYVGHKVVFPFMENPPICRNHAKVVQYADECTRDDNLSYVYGVQFLSPLANLPKFDLVLGMVQDFPHNVPFGISRTFLQDWLTNTARGSYLGSPDDKEELNEKMSLLTPPIEVRRRPRTISDSTHWNAREYENWTLFYSIPVLKGILPMKYLKNWIYLVEATYLLSKSVLTFDLINNAHRLLLHFVKEVEVLYGVNFMSYNLHILTHLSENVARWGPIFAVSTYCFENGIKMMKGLLHAQRGVPHQIERALSYRQAERILKNSCGNSTEMFAASIEPKPNKMTRYLPLDECVLVGSDSKFVGNEEEKYLLRQSQFEIDLENCKLYKKIIREKCVYTCDNIGHNSRFSNYVALTIEGDVIIIKKILLDISREKVFLFCVDLQCNTFLRMPPDVLLNHKDHCVRIVSSVRRRLKLISVLDLQTVCVHTIMNGETYITPIPNLCNVF